MSCDRYQELISADLDGEADEAERSMLATHLATCAGCAAFAEAAGGVHRSTRVAPAATIPDLTDAILDRAAADPSVEIIGSSPVAPRSRLARRAGAGAGSGSRSRVAVLAFQYGLLVVALLMMVLAVPDLFAASGEAVHTSRHLGGWDVAFAIGLLLAALQPWRARGLLPMAAALAGVMVVTAAIDIARGSTAGLAEGTHLLEVFGLVFLWLLSRSLPAGDRGRRGRPVPSDAPAAGGSVVLGLRSLPSRFGLTARPSSGTITASAGSAPPEQERTAA